MTRVSLTVQRPGGGPAILNACRQLADSVQFDRVTGLYAFATRKGVTLLSDALSGTSSSWRGAFKRWVISIDGGITEPAALRLLLALPRSEVRVFDAEEVLRRRLSPILRFHPKTLLLESRPPDFRPVGILVGSGNLTFNGLCLGHEHALSIRAVGNSMAPVTAAALHPGLSDLDAVLHSATVIDDDFVRRYEAMRPARPRMPEDVEDDRAGLILGAQPALTPIQAAGLATSDNMWIDIEYVVANRGRREEGNQIDMQRGTRVFFGFPDAPLPRNTAIGTVQLSYHGHSADRNLRFGNNQMDKLDLPIPGIEGPPSYRGTTLRFRRISPGCFDLSVGTRATTTAWKARSRALGTLYRMRSGRQFGVF